MPDVIGNINRVLSLEGLGEGGRALVGAVKAEVENILEAHDKAKRSIESANEAKREAEARAAQVETDLAEAKKAQPSKAQQERDEEELKKKLDRLAKLESERNERLLEDNDLNPKLFQRTLPGAELLIEGEGDAKRVKFQKDGNTYDSLEDLAKADGLGEREIAALRLEPKQTLPDVVIQDGREKQARVGPKTPEEIRAEKEKQDQYNL